MDQRERQNDLEEALRSLLQDYISNLWTALPGRVEAVNVDGTLTVQPTIRFRVKDKEGAYSFAQLPLLVKVPILFQRGGSFVVTLPVAIGDEVLVIFATGCIDAWWQQGGIQNQPDIRFHDLSDGFAIVGPFSVPSLPTSISTSTAQLRTMDGSAYIELTAGGAVNIVAPGGVHVTGTIDASGEISRGSHTLTQHVHGGVQPGGGNTATPHS